MAQQPGRALPKYRQIAGDLLARVEAGEFPPDTLMPTKAELIERYDASLGTVDAALAVLRHLGVAETVQGVGTFARTPPPDETGRDLGCEISRLRDEIRQLRARVDSHDHAALALMDLYGKLGFDYPRDDDAPEGESGTAADEHLA